MGLGVNFLDSDGLLRKYGTSKAIPNKAGEYSSLGPLRCIEIINLDLTTLTTTPLIISDQTFWPSNRKVDSVDVVVNTAATTGSAAALNIGLIQSDRSTSVSATGFLNAIAVAGISAAGEKFLTGDTDPGVGDIGSFSATAPTVIGYITASTSTGTFTAGNVTIRLWYRAS